MASRRRSGTLHEIDVYFGHRPLLIASFILACHLQRVLCDDGDEPLRVHEGVADYWMATDRWRACEGNQEGIKHTELRYFVDTEDHCRMLCERRAECIAIDYYTESHCCLFFDAECSMPQATADGASSYRLARAAEWAVINLTHACEGNEELVKPYMGLSQVMSTEQCKQECERRSKCVAVDYYRTSWYCNLYDVPCAHPVADHDGACSFRIVRQLKAMNYMEMKQQRIIDAKSKHMWVPHSRRHACEKNTEGVGPFWRAKVENIAICSALCADHIQCTAFDFYTEDLECLLYKKLCVKPKAEGAGASSWVLNIEPSQWEVLNPGFGCSHNNEGVKPMDSIQRETLDDCKRLCDRILDCVGVDWKGRAGDTKRWCVLFNQSCLKPAGKDFSSYLVVRPATLAVRQEQGGTGMRGWLQRHLRAPFSRQPAMAAPSLGGSSAADASASGGLSIAEMPGMFVASIFATVWVLLVLALRTFCSAPTLKYL